MKKTLLGLLLATIICIGLTSAYDIIGDDLVSEWTCDDTFDDTQKINNGTEVGSVPFYATGKVGKACAFNGNDANYINIGSSDTLNPDNLTICAYVYQNTTGRKGVMVQAPAVALQRAFSFSIGVVSNYRPSLRVSYDGTNNEFNESRIAAKASAWSFICVAFQQNTQNITIYINGTLREWDQLTAPYAAGIFNSPVDAYIGRDQAASRAWSGYLDEITLWKDILNSTEINRIYTNYSGGTRPLYNYTVYTYPDAAITTTEEDMSLASWNEPSPGGSTVDIEATFTNDAIGYRYWMYYNISNINGRVVNITMTNPNTGAGSAMIGSNPIHPVVSCDGETWTYATQAIYISATTDYAYWFTATCDSMLVATHQPTPYTAMHDFYDTIAASTYAEIINTDYTDDGNNVTTIKITNSAETKPKNTVVIFAGQHGNSETIGMHMMNGILKYLINATDATAALIRNNTIYYLVPMTNPDSFKEGNTKLNEQNEDLNDHWHDGTCTEDVDMAAYFDTIDPVTSIDLFIDLHGLGGDVTTSYINSFNVATLGAALYANQSKLLGNLSTYTEFDTDYESGTTSVDNARYHFWRNYTTLSLTIEPQEMTPTRTLAKMEETGKNITKAIYAFMGATPASAVADTPNYYFSQSGSDSNNCSSTTYACKTIAKLNTITLDPGDTVYFECGDTWRFPEDAWLIMGYDGNKTHDITYTNYGTCTVTTKPKMMGSIAANNAADWTNIGGNIWRWSETSMIEVSNIVGNDATGFTRSTTYAGLNTQNEYFYNHTNNRTYVYSTTNPGTLFSTSLEVAPGDEDDYGGFIFPNRDYITIDGFEVTNFGWSAIYGWEVTNINITNNTVTWYGGTYTGTTRYGDGIAFGLNQENISITYNTVEPTTLSLTGEIKDTFKQKPFLFLILFLIGAATMALAIEERQEGWGTYAFMGIFALGGAFMPILWLFAGIPFILKIIIPLYRRIMQGEE